MVKVSHAGAIKAKEFFNVIGLSRIPHVGVMPIPKLARMIADGVPSLKLIRRIAVKCDQGTSYTLEVGNTLGQKYTVNITWREIGKATFKQG